MIYLAGLNIQLHNTFMYLSVNAHSNVFDNLVYINVALQKKNQTSLPICSPYNVEEIV